MWVRACIVARVSARFYFKHTVSEIISTLINEKIQNQWTILIFSIIRVLKCKEFVFDYEIVMHVHTIIVNYIPKSSL